MPVHSLIMQIILFVNLM